MKIKFNKNKAVDNATIVGSTAVGYMLSRGVGKILPPSVQNTPAKVGIAMAGVLLASSVQGADVLASVTKGIATGFAVENTAAVISKVGEDFVEEAPESTSDKFLSGVFGMNGSQLPVYQPMNYALSPGSFQELEEEEEETLQGGFSQG